MRKHAEPILKYVCLILAALVLYQLVGLGRRVNPLRGVTVPALPTLTADTNSNDAGVSPVNSKPNSVVNAGTNLPSSSKTNLSLMGGTNGSLPVGTNPVSLAASTHTISTNTVVNTNSVASTGSGRNVSSSSKTNSEHTVIVLLPTGTNAVLPATGTNTVSTNQVALTNSVAPTTNGIKSTHQAGNASSPTGRMPMSMRGGMSMGKSATLPPAIQAQITKIIDSEILGPLPHPLPMALMGIAGDMAFLRSPDGQMGAVKLGDSLGEIKLVRIGINRVLVEQDGQQKELTIFDGHGSESLLDKQGGTNNETH